MTLKNVCLGSALVLAMTGSFAYYSSTHPHPSFFAQMRQANQEMDYLARTTVEAEHNYRELTAFLKSRQYPEIDRGLEAFLQLSGGTRGVNFQSTTMDEAVSVIRKYNALTNYLQAQAFYHDPDLTAKMDECSRFSLKKQCSRSL
ncbi:hypothetical protein HZB02_00140 [Candidatus Woesearchaeota archaeon]|nr:hypothetical protein [Candidatus Woesearchaeota archaeon]